MTPEILAAMVGLAVLAPAVWLYNRLVAGRNLGRQGFADIDVQLKRRADLVPRLVEAVRAYAAHWGVAGLCALDLQHFVWSGPED